MSLGWQARIAETSCALGVQMSAERFHLARRLHIYGIALTFC
jgi:hypothetical protein